MSLNESAAIGIPCPKCGEKTDQTIGWLKANKQFTFRCGEVITVESEKLLEGF